MTTATETLDLFCRVNVQSDMPHDAFTSFITQSLGGNRCMNLITTNKLDIAVDDNDVFDTEKARTGKDRWLYFRYSLEIDPVAGVSAEEYVVAIGNLLKSLWSSGLDAVAASDFEDQLPRNVRRLQWPTGEQPVKEDAERVEMKNMAKGKAYEIEVADTVETELIQGNLGLDPKLAAVRRKPAYFSRDRKKDIRFDVSIEVCRKGVSVPYWIWVWECKDYSHTVPVDDAEEFHAKLEQIGADRTKGSMITPIGFDSGTVEYAQSKGIGLWRYVPQGSLVSLMEDTRGVSEVDILRALTTPATNGFRFYGFFYGLTCDGQLTTDQNELIHVEFQDVVKSERQIKR